MKRWNSRVQGAGSFNQTGRPEVPETVFEELLINALIHRDYFIKDSIKVFIFDDRIEIRSPGKLPNSLTVEQIRRGVRWSRNVLLASHRFSKRDRVQIVGPGRTVRDVHLVQRSADRGQHAAHLLLEQLADAADAEAVHLGQLAGIDDETCLLYTSRCV